MDIWLKSNLDAHSFIPNKYWIDNYALVKELLPKSIVYLYWLNQEIVGFIGLQDNYIAGVFVYNKYRNLGIGKVLLDFIKDKHTNLTLSVFEKNIKAYNFYIKNGFQVNKKTLVFENLFEFEMIWNKEKQG